MIGVITNAVAVVLGSALGLLFKKGISQKITDALMIGVGLCIICIGITGMLDGKNILVIMTSVVLGTIAGKIVVVQMLRKASLLRAFGFVSALWPLLGQ